MDDIGKRGTIFILFDRSHCATKIIGFSIIREKIQQIMKIELTVEVASMCPKTGNYILSILIHFPRPFRIWSLEAT